MASQQSEWSKSKSAKLTELESTNGVQDHATKDYRAPSHISNIVPPTVHSGPPFYI